MVLESSESGHDYVVYAFFSVRTLCSTVCTVQQDRLKPYCTLAQIPVQSAKRKRIGSIKR
jgi:hypothetical protein